MNPEQALTQTWKVRFMDFRSHLFPTLQFLDHNMNELFGTIPIEISKLSKLTPLNLSSNKLSGGNPTIDWTTNQS